MNKLPIFTEKEFTKIEGYDEKSFYIIGYGRLTRYIGLTVNFYSDGEQNTISIKVEDELRMYFNTNGILQEIVGYDEAIYMHEMKHPILFHSKQEMLDYYSNIDDDLVIPTKQNVNENTVSERGVSNTLSCMEEYHKMCEYLDDLAGRISKKPDERDISNKAQTSTNCIRN